ncbi:MAG: HMA2 domain-containing protein [Gammaproteobacteria bacterium]
MLPDSARICHATRGRLRIGVPGRRGDTGYFDRARSHLEQLDGVESLRVNPLTGSIIIEHDNLSIEALHESALRAGLFELRRDTAIPDRAAPPDPAMTSPGTSGLFGLMPSAGDTRNIVVLVLVVMALLQLSRGRVMVPAMSLLWYAFELSRR